MTINMIENDRRKKLKKKLSEHQEMILKFPNISAIVVPEGQKQKQTNKTPKPNLKQKH